MNAIRVLCYKSFARFFSNKAAVVLTFAVPIAMIYIFGLVFQVDRKSSGPSGIPLAVINASSAPVGDKLLQALKREKAFSVRTQVVLADKSTRPLTEDDARAAIRNNEYRYAVVLPRDLAGSGAFGLHLKIL